jgi:hypothetical protein
MLKDELAVREYLFSIIEGFTGVYSGWTSFPTVDLIKIFLALGVPREL